MSSTPLLPTDHAADEAALRIAVGSRIREARTRRGLSGRRLAALARVTPAFISQVERGQVIPSVSTLLRLMNVLGMKAGDVFDAAEPAPDQVLDRADWAVFEWPDRSSEDALLTADPQERIEVVWVRMAPGATSGDELIQNDAEIQWVFVLKGRLELQVGNVRHLLREHSSITIDGQVPHGYRNPTGRPVEYIALVAPAVYSHARPALRQTGASTSTS